AVVTNVLPHYRAAFYRALFARSDLQVHVFCADSMPGMDLKLVHQDFPERVTTIPAPRAAQERVGWQWLPWSRLVSDFDVWFVHGNPRIVSNLVLSCLGRVARKPLVIWGQAHTAGSNPGTERVRLAWWKGFDHFLVYT